MPEVPSRARNTRLGCLICQRLTPQELLELDALVGDPLAWPSTVWGMFSKPEGDLPASYRRFGAMRVGREWLDEHGYGDIGKQPLRRHVRYDVVHVAHDPVELIGLGLIARSRGDRRIPTNPKLDAGAFITYFNAGIQAGAAAHQLLAEHINRLLDKGEEVPVSLLGKLADMGASFAKTQAQLMARGVRFERDTHEDDSFRGPPDELPSPRIEHHRIRNVEGERRPVTDAGPADRARYAARRAEEGRDGI